MRYLRFLLRFGVAAYCVTLVALYFAQTKLLYLNDAGASDPVAAGFPEAAVFRLATADGERIEAWYVAPAPGRPLALYFHGNGGSLRNRGYALRALTADGMGVLAIDYRGFGRSSGEPSEEGLKLDADAAYAKALDLGFPPRDIVLVGESLGSGVAVDLAARREVGGVILDSPYSSTVDVAAARYWMFPVSLLMRDRFRSDEKIAGLRAPLLVMHRARDRVIPLRFGEKLFALAPEPKEMFVLDGPGHPVLPTQEGAAKVQAWVQNLERTAAR